MSEQLNDEKVTSVQWQMDGALLAMSGDKHAAIMAELAIAVKCFLEAGIAVGENDALIVTIGVGQLTPM